MTLSKLLQQLQAREYVPLTEGDADEQVPWFEEGRIVEVPEVTYFYFLEVLPPRWMSGHAFCFAEGRDCFRLFWRREKKYLARQLSVHETERFCRLSGSSRDSS